MTVLWSTWAATPPRMDGTIVDEEWRGADVNPLPIPGEPPGRVMIQNDARFLYLAIDLPVDTEPAVNTGDYFYFSVDVDRDGAISPNIDVNYAQAFDDRNILIRQLYLGPNVWTGGLLEPSDSMAIRGFGPTSLAARPHTTWTAQFELGELQPPPDGVIFFGLRVASDGPAFTHDVPAGFTGDFSSLVKLHLAERPAIPADLAGEVIAGVGLVPATQIVDGYATTDPGYRLAVRDAAFGGVVDLIGNGDTLARLWAAGARRYRIQHQHAGQGFAPIDQAWVNYQLVGRRYELRTFGPDAAHTYPMTDPGDDYSIEDLLLQWNSTVSPSGRHEFRTEFFAADGSPVGTGLGQTLALEVANGRPVASVDSVTGPDGRPVRACDLVRYEEGQAVQIQVTATDPRGLLGHWALVAEYGDGRRDTLGGESYPATAPPDRRWTGVSPATVSYSPPRTCAYQFRVSANLRVTDGYTASIGGTTAFKIGHPRAVVTAPGNGGTTAMVLDTPLTGSPAPGVPGPVAVDGTRPVAAGAPRREGMDLRSVLELVGAVAAPTSLLVGLAVYFGVVYVNAQAFYFGIDGSNLGFSTQDYVLRSADALFVPLGALAVAGIALLSGHAAFWRWAAAPGHRRAARLAAWALSLVGTLLFSAGTVSVFRPLPFHTPFLFGPLSLGAGALACGYGAWARGGVGPRAPAGARRVAVAKTVLIGFVVVISLFWAASDYARALGRGRSALLEANLAYRPGVTLFSPEPLHLEGAGVKAQELSGSQYRYDGLRLFIRSDGKYFLLPAAWSPAAGRAIVLPDDDRVRVEFTVGAPS